MVSIEGRYLGGLRCEATHKPSGRTLTTDAPVDNMGKGETFSPTDLVATALGTCIVTIIAIVAERHGLDVTGATFRVEKHMAASPTRRIGRLPVTVRLPATLSAESRKLLEQAAHTCPVHKSLHPDVDASINFLYEEVEM